MNQITHGRPNYRPTRLDHFPKPSQDGKGNPLNDWLTDRGFKVSRVPEANIKAMIKATGGHNY